MRYEDRRQGRNKNLREASQKLFSGGSRTIAQYVNSHVQVNLNLKLASKSACVYSDFKQSDEQ